MKRLLARVRGEAGYSLIEMLVVLSILGVVMGSLTVLFVSASNAETNMSIRWKAQQNARFALDRVRREIHCASSVAKGSPVTGTPGPLAAASVTMVLPAGCSGPGGTISWCTQGSGQRWALYRVAGAGACSTGTLVVDYLTLPNVFDYTAPATGSGLLAKISVDFPVNERPDKPSVTYELRDDIVLRNSTRG